MALSSHLYQGEHVVQGRRNGEGLGRELGNHHPMVLVYTHSCDRCTSGVLAAISSDMFIGNKRGLNDLANKHTTDRGRGQGDREGIRAPEAPSVK